MNHIEEIDAMGDVILVCGREGAQEKLRVSSTMLSRSSSVFQTLLSSARPTADDQVQANGTFEILLLDDEPFAMRLICNVAHSQRDRVPRGLQAEQFRQVAELVEKYDMCRAVSPYVESWVHALRGWADNPTLQSMLVSVCKMRHREGFALVAHAILLQNTKKPLHIPDNEVPTDLKEVFNTLWQQRRDTLDKLFEPISTILREATRLHRMSGARCDRQCPATARYLQYLADKFAMAGLWPEPWDRDKRVVDVLEAMRTVDISEVEFILWPGVQRCASCDLDLRGEAINGLKRRLRDAADRVEDEIRGLCYECLRSGMLGSGACEHRKGEQMEVAGRQ